MAASGNDGRELQIFNYYDPSQKHTEYSDKRYDFPASYPEVIGIAATGRKLSKGKPPRQMVDYFPAFSNWGPAIDLSAPSSRIESTRNDESGEEYGTGGGTSYASPHVSATAALVLAKYPGLSPGEVRDHLMATAEPLSTIDPAGDYGEGLVDAEAAVNTPPGTPLAPARYTVSPIGKLSVTWGELRSK